jgi:hypothetical protein
VVIADRGTGGDALAGHPSGDAGVELPFGVTLLAEVVGQAHGVQGSERR